jgi:hypothetical protein
VADHLGVVHLWEAATRQEFHCFEGAENALRLAFLPDGFTLATTGPEETTILLWDVLGTRTARSGAGLDRAELNRLWSDLDRPDATVAYRVLRTLATDPDGAVGWFRDHLHPQPLAGRERIKGLIEDLGSDRYSAREHATRELRALDTEALPALRKALKSAPTLETRRRIEQLIDQAEASPHPDRLRGTRAVQLFEALATPAARELLKEWAAGPPGGWLTEDAAVALKRLDRRPAAEGARP